ncbi:hypothetical protein IL306_003288 [Fusarium sp. DS 682]|nr:hypothetical protein IL306_003288 [Fusarium sp. DS 682]
MAPSQTQDTAEPAQKSADLLEHPKGESILTNKDRKALIFTDKHSSPDVYVNSSKDTLWHPWTGTLELKPLRFETRSGSFVIGLRTPVDCWLGKHRHRGTVTAVTLSGNWRYKEYDWVAGPGDYVVENPGTIHTLFMGAGAEVVFTITGSLEFFNDDDSLRETMDIFSFAELYHDHCEEKAGTIAVLTGESSANGRAISLSRPRKGWLRSSLLRSPTRSQTRRIRKKPCHYTHELIKKLGGESIFRRCDMSNSAQIEELVSKAAYTFRRLDIMVNNAGIFTGLKNILEETDKYFDRTIQAEDVQSHIAIDKIINIASIGGLIGLAREPAYCASKGAVVNLTRQLAVDFGPSHIKFNALCPRFLATAMVRPFTEDKALNESLRDATPWPPRVCKGCIGCCSLFCFVTE